MARSEELIKKIYNAVQEVYDNQVTLELQKGWNAAVVL